MDTKVRQLIDRAIRWIFYSAVNSITPQIILNLGFEDNSWSIAIRQLAFQIPSIAFSMVVTWWATRFKDLSESLYHNVHKPC